MIRRDGGHNRLRRGGRWNARSRKLLNDHEEGRHGEPVRHVVPEMSSTHFSETTLRGIAHGMPRTPVGGERLGKHGALSDGPSTALRPYCGPRWTFLYPITHPWTRRRELGPFRSTRA
ncbi:hypothetical protein KM043_017820 [Ampulex compressa]|nr:hypothetical protein KM043_017820 [Ampulex compressa]